MNGKNKVGFVVVTSFFLAFCIYGYFTKEMSNEVIIEKMKTELAENKFQYDLTVAAIANIQSTSDSFDIHCGGNSSIKIQNSNLNKSEMINESFVRSQKIQLIDVVRGMKYQFYFLRMNNKDAGEATLLYWVNANNDNLSEYKENGYEIVKGDSLPMNSSKWLYLIDFNWAILSKEPYKGTL